MHLKSVGNDNISGAKTMCHESCQIAIVAALFALWIWVKLFTSSSFQISKLAFLKLNALVTFFIKHSFLVIALREANNNCSQASPFRLCGS